MLLSDPEIQKMLLETQPTTLTVEEKHPNYVNGRHLLWWAGKLSETVTRGKRLRVDDAGPGKVTVTFRPQETELGQHPRESWETRLEEIMHEIYLTCPRGR